MHAAVHATSWTPKASGIASAVTVPTRWAMMKSARYLASLIVKRLFSLTHSLDHSLVYVLRYVSKPERGMVDQSRHSILNDNAEKLEKAVRTKGAHTHT